MLKLSVDLPDAQHIDIMVSSAEQVQEIRQSIVDQPHTFQYSCFHLEYAGKKINDFVELSEIEGLVKDEAPRLRLVEDPYTEAAARMHVVRVRELIGASGNRVDYVLGVDAGGSLCEDVEMKGGHAAKEEASPVADYDFDAPAPLSTLLPKPREPAPKTVKGLSVSPWNPPPYHLRMQGHLLYLQVTTQEGEQHHITSHTTGFYLNKSTTAKFDPSPRPPPKDIHAHSLITLLERLSPLFGQRFRELQEYNGARDPLASYAISNSIPAAPWAVAAPANGAHQADTARTQEAFLLSGADGTDTLRDWNEELQSTRELPRTSVQDRVFRERLTSKLFAEYNEAAVRGAVLVARGEVQALNPTEARDAQIFVYNNVFYSFGADGVGTFAAEGGDEAARVATGKDVGGVRSVNQVDLEGLFTPGTVVVDYCGKRVVGQSIVPGIFKQRGEGEHQIDYGGVEGKEVVASDEAFVSAFAELSKGCRVKKHAVWDKEGKRHELEASVETKGLKGTDGRKYVLDLYRLTPLDVAWIEKYRDGVEEEKAEARYPHRMAVLRSECVDAYRISKLREYIAAQLKKKKGAGEQEQKKEAANGETNGEAKTEEESKPQETVDVSGFTFALNPDVFAGQQPQTDEEKAAMAKDEEEVRAVCSFLTGTLLPQLVHDLQEGEIGFPMDGAGLVREMHKRGVNARYLGEIVRVCEEKQAEVKRKYEETPEADKEKERDSDKRLELLVAMAKGEMVKRGFKHTATRLLKPLPPAMVQSAVAHLLNCLLGGQLNTKPEAVVDESGRAMYPDTDMRWTELSPASLATEIRQQVRRRFQHSLAASADLVPKGREVQVLREVCLKMGWQVEAKEYRFGKDCAALEVPSQGLAEKASSESLGVPQTNGDHGAGSGSSKNKKKKKHASDRAVSPSPSVNGAPPAVTTFAPANVLNVVPLVKHSAPRSLLAEEALDAGRLSLQQDQKELGQELLLESLSLHEQIYGILHPEVARVYYALSTLYFSLEEKNAAVELAKKAVIVSERTLGVDDPETIMGWLNWGLMEHATGNTRGALRLVRHALDLWKITWGPGHPDSITTLNNAAVMLQSLKLFKASRDWFAQSLRLCEAVSGAWSVNSATLAFQYAQALALDRDSKAAVGWMRQSARVFRHRLGEANGNTREAEQWLGTLTRAAVSQASAEKQAASLLQSGAGSRRLGLRAAGSRGAAVGPGVAPPANGVSGVVDGAPRGIDQRSLDELVRFVNGGSPRAAGKTAKKTPAIKGKKVGGAAKSTATAAAASS